MPAGLTAEQVVQWLSAHSCAFFASQYLSGPPEPPYNGRFLISEHHEAWSTLVSTTPRLCILAPRDHGKSFFFNMAYPIWQAEKHPGRYGFIFSGSQPQAERILRDIVQEVESNPRLQHLVPRVKKHWSATAVRFRNGHTIYARGYGTKVRGAHPIWISCDDVLNDDDAYSETKRNRNIDYFYNAITPMCVPGGQIVVVGTPFHQNDLYSNLAENEEYVFRKFSAIQDNGTALWPERYSIQRLKARQKEVGRVRFAREYQCSPVSDGSSLFPLNLFDGPDVLCDDLVLGRDWRWWQTNKNIVSKYIGVDYAISANVGADYTVLFVVGLDKFGNRYVLDIIRRKGLQFQEQLHLIRLAAKKYAPDIIACESNQMQRVFGDELIRTTDLPIRNIQTGDEKHSLERGVPALRVLLENRKVRIPRGDARSREMTDIWIDELRNHTFHQGKVKSVGAHDDTAMAWFLAEKAIRAGAFSFAFGEQDGDAAALEAELSAIDNVPQLYQTDNPHLAAALNAPIPGSSARSGGSRSRMVNAPQVEEDDYLRDQNSRPKSTHPRVLPAEDDAEVLDSGRAPSPKDFLDFGGWWYG